MHSAVLTRRSSYKPGFWQRMPAERLTMLTRLCEDAVDTYLIRCRRWTLNRTLTCS